LISHTIPPVLNIVDTTGAGDAFAAGFLSEYLKGENDYKECLGSGVKMAEKLVQIQGCNLIDL
jgi:sugar/nucleoside kinase (ribokinase family)